ncbi:MAG: septal ring lytic transglycosylase RlpA family protein, partial [Amphiplicatus sp.]
MIRGLSVVGGYRFVAFALATLGLAACATPGARPDGAANAHYKIGKPYQVNGRWYHPHEQPDYDAVGVASWYGDEFHGRPTANGERFDKNRLSAAHTTLPLPSVVEVENLENGRRVMVRVNDRGPFVGDRMIDLSHAAARALGFDQKGLAKVRVRYLGRAELAALAPRPGEKALPVKRAAPRVTVGEPAPAVQSVQAAPLPPAVAPLETDDAPPDIIAQLIGEADPEPAKGGTPVAAATAPVSEIWID